MIKYPYVFTSKRGHKVKVERVEGEEYYFTMFVKGQPARMFTYMTALGFPGQINPEVNLDEKDALDTFRSLTIE